MYFNEYSSTYLITITRKIKYFTFCIRLNLTHFLIPNKYLALDLTNCCVLKYFGSFLEFYVVTRVFFSLLHIIFL